MCYNDYISLRKQILNQKLFKTLCESYDSRKAQGSHPGNRGSIPREVTNLIIETDSYR